jgi:hypothetical protein
MQNDKSPTSSRWPRLLSRFRINVALGLIIALSALWTVFVWLPPRLVDRPDPNSYHTESARVAAENSRVTAETECAPPELRLLSPWQQQSAQHTPLGHLVLVDKPMILRDRDSLPIDTQSQWSSSGMRRQKYA